MNIGIFTVGRSDYGIWRPIIQDLSKNKNLNLNLIVTGSHFSKKYGYTINEIKKDNFCNIIYSKLPNAYDQDSPLSSSIVISKISLGVGRILKTNKFDLILLLGDRYETASLANIITLFSIPIMHFHGGSITEGSFDDNYRHAISKLSNFHMVETNSCKNRLVQMGEPKKNIKVIGAPSLSFLNRIKWKNFKYYSNEFKIKKKNYIILTLHPETNSNKKYNINMVNSTIKALKDYKGKVIITAPNADPNNNYIMKKYNLLMKNNQINKYIFREHLGHENYFNLLRYCEFVIGNSSSGIIESASFKIPAINIGNRQKNREFNNNVIHAKTNYQSIAKAINSAIKMSSTKKLKKLKNIYFKKNYSATLTKFIKNIKFPISSKKFIDL